MLQRKIIIFLFVFISAISVLNATVYYVAMTGNDTNNGTSLSTAFKTIQKAANIMVAGDTCYVRQGTYRETVTPTNSGNSTNPIRFYVYNNESVTVSGADIFNVTWSVHFGSIYKASTNLSFIQLFVDGKMMNEARWPNAVVDDLMHMPRGTTDSGSDVSTIVDSDLPAGDWNNAYVQLMFEYWGYIKRVTNYQAGSQFNFDTALPGGYGPRAGSSKYYLFGKLIALDTATEWYLDNPADIVYLWTPDSLSPSQHSVEIKQRDYAFNLSNKSYIELKGFNLFACAVNMSNSQHCTVDSFNVKYGDHNSVHNDGYGAIYQRKNIMSGSYNEWKNSTIAYSAHAGVLVYGSYNKVTNCVIHDIGYLPTTSAAIATPSSSNNSNQTFNYNTIYNCGYIGVMFYTATKYNIQYNDISNVNLLCNDGGVLYTYQSDGGGTVISYNWTHDNRGNLGIGIYLDNGSKNFIVHHNVSWNNKDSGIRLNLDSTNNLIYNNTILNNGNSFNHWPDSGSQSGTKIINNIANNTINLVTSSEGTPPEAHHNGDYPVDANFIPTAGSGAIDAGVIIPGYTDGYVGSSPDIGAYEYGATYYWIPGARLESNPPSTIGNLTTSNLASTSVNLNWTAVGDDGTTGTATTYDIRYMIGTPVTNSNWSSATQCTGESTPKATGSAETFTVNNLIPDTNYYFAIKVKDDSQNWSEVSNSPSGRTLAGSPAIGEWHFEENTGTTAGDSSGNNNNGTLVNGPVWTTGKIGKGLQFNGGNYVSIPNSASLNPTTALTIEAWFRKTADVAYQRILAKSNYPNWEYALYFGDTGAMQGAIGVGGTTRYSSMSSVLSVGTWYFVTLTYDNSRLRLYVNGVEQGSGSSITGSIDSRSESFCIGKDGGTSGAYFSGIIDEVVVYNRCLTPAEILAHYNRDIVAPAAINTLITNSPTTNSITLFWTSVGDDGTTGTATSYDIRYITGTAVTSSNWNTAVQCTGEPAPKANGNSETFTVTGLAVDTTYYFSIKAADDYSNLSEISNSPNGKTQPLRIYYVDTTGTDSNSNDGSSLKPWKTLAYAVSHVPVNQGCTVHLNAGTYNETQTSLVPAGINIEGSGMSNTIIKGSLSSEGSYLIKADNYPAVNGNQTFSNFTIDGNNRTLEMGMRVSGRHNVTIHDVTFKNINHNGLTVHSGQYAENIQTPAPSTYITGFKLYNSTFTNTSEDCPAGSYSHPLNWNSGAIHIGHLTGALIHDITINENGGFGIKGTDMLAGGGYLKGVKIYNCVINVPKTDPYWVGDASIELWNMYDNCEIYNCTVNNWFSLVAGNKGAGQYSIKVYNNSLILPSGGGQKEAIEVGASDMIMSENYIEGFGSCFGHWNATISNVIFNNNIVYKCSGGGVYICPEGRTATNIYFYNNVFDLSNGSADFFVLGGNTNASNVRIRNNILIGSGSNRDIYYQPQASHMLSSYFTNNIRYNVVSGNYTAGDFTVNNNINSNPSIIGIGYRRYTYYTLQSNSPCIDAGVSITGFTTYYIGAAPDIGRYEYGDTALPTGELAGEWHLEENIGTTASDTSGNNNNGTLTNSPQWVTGITGNALQFNGINNYVSVANSASLDIKDALTISVWAYPTRIPVMHDDMVSKDDRIGVRWDGANLRPAFIFKIDDGGNNWRWVISPDVVSLNAWVHIVAVYDKNGGANNMKLYVDGVQKAVGTYTDTIESTTNPLTIGRYSNRNFQGIIDEVKIYNRALTASEVLSEYNSAIPDATAPSTINNLTTSEITTTSITLNWTAVGDDGTTGTASSYDIRYATYSITSSNFSNASAPPAGEPTPRIGGSNESFTVTGLSSDTTYYFGLKVADEVPNYSVISNIASGKTQLVVVVDSTAPATIGTLAANNPTMDSITLRWVSVGDDGTTGRASIYDIRYQTYVITSDNFANATECTGEPTPNIAGSNETYTATNLQADTTYYFSMKAGDEVINWSGISNVVIAKTQGEVVVSTPAVCELRFEEGIGTTVSDTSGNSNTGTLYNNPEWVIGKVGNYAIEFDGLNTYISIPDNNTLDATTGLTVEAWVKSDVITTDGGVTRRVIEKGVYSLGASDKAYFRILVNGITYSVSKPWTTSDIGLWHHLVGTYDSSGGTNNLKLYQDGILVASSTAVGDIYTNTTNLVIGRQGSTTGRFDGTIDEIRIYKRTLTYEEVQSHYIGIIPSNDTTPPGNIGNLTTGNLTTTSIILNWTAVGDDGTTGIATSYDIRYATYSINTGNWDTITQCTNETSPQNSGHSETFTVTGLTADTTYYFGIKVADERGNESTLSNIATGKTQQETGDLTAPAMIDTLTTENPTYTSITLQWQSVGDDGTTGTATNYDIRYQTYTITSNNFANATQCSGTPIPNTAGNSEYFVISNLAIGTTYHFGIKVGDEVPNWSSISNIATGRTLGMVGDITPPAAITTLTLSSTTLNSITITWTSPGDDDVTGTATGYDIRYLQGISISTANWGNAIQASGEVISPQVSGSSETYGLTGLSAGTLYYIGIKSYDESGNYSGISNIIEAMTLRQLADSKPNSVSYLTTSQLDNNTIQLSWLVSSSSDVASYRIYIATGENVMGYTTPYYTVTSTQNQVTITGLTANQDYKFVVRAVNGSGAEEENTNIICETAVTTTDSTTQSKLTTPINGIKISGNKVLLLTDTLIGSISGITYEYRKVGETEWTAIPVSQSGQSNPDTGY